MICSKCKKQVQGHKSICPHCNALFIPEEDNKASNKMNVNTSGSNKIANGIVALNQLTNNNNIYLVGGATSGATNNNAPVSIKKSSHKNDVKRNKFVNYIDYQEAKGNADFLEHKKEYTKQMKINAKKMNGKLFSVEKVRRSPKIALGFLKSAGHAQMKDVGSATTKRYANPLMIGGISKNGKLVKVEFVHEASKKRKGFSTGDIFYYMFIITLWVLVIGLILNISGVDYYFDQNGNKIGSNTISNVSDYDGYEGVSKSGQDKNEVSNGETSIIYDNQYFKMFTLYSERDLNAVIRSDSLKQKENCSTEIINIENQIINNYGVVAVNLCEMDVEFANELKNVVAYVYNNYPSARHYLTNITLANVEDTGSFIAAFMPVFTFVTSDTASGYPVGSKSQILLNAKYFLNTSKIENSASYGSQTGYFPPNATRSSTVAHEFGHYLSYVALLNYYNSGKLNYVTTADASTLYKVYDDFNSGNFSRILLEEAYDEYVKIYGSGLNFLQFRQSISKYAISKDSTGSYIYDETIAEAFHDCYLNGNNAKPASRMIMKVLETKL